MRHDYRLDGEAFRLRPLEVADAAFVLALRTDQTLARHLNPTSPDIADQVAWTERYFDRPGDFYFIVERLAGEPEGAVALYDEQSGVQAEWGRWILKPGSLAAAESGLLIHRFGFEARNLRRIYCRTLAANAPVLAFHRSAGLREVGPRAESIEHEADPANWPTIEQTLAMGAHRAALLLRRRG